MVQNGSTKFQLEVSKKKKKKRCRFTPAPIHESLELDPCTFDREACGPQMTCLRSLPCVHGSQRSAGLALASRQQGPPRQLRNSPVLPNKMQQKTTSALIGSPTPPLTTDLKKTVMKQPRPWLAIRRASHCREQRPLILDPLWA